MNNTRRKAIRKIIEELYIQKDAIEMVQEEEQEAFDNLPEGIQYSERGEAMEESADELSDIMDELGDLIDRLEEIAN